MSYVMTSGLFSYFWLAYGDVMSHLVDAWPYCFAEIAYPHTCSVEHSIVDFVSEQTEQTIDARDVLYKLVPGHRVTARVPLSKVTVLFQYFYTLLWYFAGDVHLRASYATHFPKGDVWQLCNRTKPANPRTAQHSPRFSSNQRCRREHFRECQLLNCKRSLAACNQWRSAVVEWILGIRQSQQPSIWSVV